MLAWPRRAKARREPSSGSESRARRRSGDRHAWRSERHREVAAHVVARTCRCRRRRCDDRVVVPARVGRGGRAARAALSPHATQRPRRHGSAWALSAQALLRRRRHASYAQRTAMIVDELRVIGSTQTNVVMAAELIRVAQRAIKQRPPEPRKEGLGQLVYPFDRDLAWAAVTYMRTPTRVVWDVYRSRATRLEPLYEELVADIRDDKRALWRDGDGISVEARRVDEFGAGERQIVGTVKNALIDTIARRGLRLHVDPERPATRWVARGDEHGELVISIDLGGGSLSQRGWR